MPKKTQTTIEAKGLQIALHTTADQADYISLTAPNIKVMLLMMW